MTMDTHDWANAIDTEGMRTAILTVGDRIVTHAFDGALVIDTITDLGKPEQNAADNGKVRFIAATRRWPDNPDAVQNQGVFYWSPVNEVHQVQIVYTGEPGVSALI
jgi:hypothetical protein